MKTRIALAVVATLAIAQLPFAEAAQKAPLDDALETARDFLLANRGEYGVLASDLDELRLNGGHRAAHTGTLHVYLRQQVRGIDVMTGDVSMAIQPTGAVAHVGSRLLRAIDARAEGSSRLDAVAAVRAAAAALNLRPDATLRALGVSTQPMRGTLVSPAGISIDPIPARLVYQPAGERLRLGWELEIRELSEFHWWNVVVDAENGAVLAKLDYVVHEGHRDMGASIDRLDEQDGDAATRESDVLVSGQFGETDGAQYRVYEWPKESPNDGPRTLVTNVADPASSPFGWHDVDGAPGAEFTNTRGNNVHAYWDIAPGVPIKETGRSSEEGLVFDHPLDLTGPPVTYVDAAITNLFYWNNINHDVFANYGFDESAGNFQQKNYFNNETAVGGDAVVAQGQDGTPYLCNLGAPVPAACPPIDNANFSTPPEGKPPRMQMYNWLATPKRQIRDGDLDAGIITHEYGHGISIRLTGGPFNVGCLNNDEQAGEGWSDFFAIALTARADEATLRRGLATYSMGEDSRTGTGLRPAAYRASTSTPKYNNIKSAAVPHGVGWVWAAMLWDLHWDLVAEGRNSAGATPLGFNPNLYAPWNTGGNNLALQLVMDGLKLQACSPGFVDSRNAILSADDLLTGVEDDPDTLSVNESIGTGANRCVIWRSFASRGLGFSAKQGSPASATDGTQAVDLPPDCLSTP